MLQRWFTRIAHAIILAMIPITAAAQLQYFDFGADANTPRANVPVVVFFAGNQLNYTVTTTVKDMVFDAQGRYSQQLMAGVFTAKLIRVPTGFFHTRMFPYNRNVSGDVADKFDEMLGCGTYHFTLFGGTIGYPGFGFDLDLTDARWGEGYDNSFRNILIEPVNENGWKIDVSISIETRLSTQLIYCGRYDGSERIRYWELLRFHGGTWSTYTRNRNGFSIAPSIATPDPTGAMNPSEVPYNHIAVPDQTLVINTEITDNITVPDGHTFKVGTEYTQLPDSNDTQVTFVRFAANKGITVEGGGKLVSKSNGPSGTVIWECVSSTTPGSWTGIRTEPGAELAFEVSYVRNAVKGIVFNQTSSASLLGCVIERSSEIGLDINDCSPNLYLCESSQSGIWGGQAHGANVYITGANAAPEFKYCVINDAIRATQSGVTDYGNGVEITGTSVAATFEDCVVQGNESYGFYIHDTHGPYINGSCIDLNGVYSPAAGGILIQRGSFWTTLQNSAVRYNQSTGIRLEGTSDDPARLRGWWDDDDLTDPSNPADVPLILAAEPLGRNCISYNGVNIYAAATAIVDLGAPYSDTNGIIHVLGGHNSICNPSMMSQARAENASTARLQENWWNADYSIYADATSTADYSNEIATDEVYCVSDRKAIAYRTGSMVRDMLEMRRNPPREQQHSTAAPTDAGSTAMTAMLSAAFPNPFNPTIQLDVTVAVTQDVHLSIFDSRGRQIAVLADKSYDFGTHTFTFDASALPSGTYYAVLRTANGSVSRALTLLK